MSRMLPARLLSLSNSQVTFLSLSRSFFGTHGRSNNRANEILWDHLNVSLTRNAVKGFRTLCTGKALTNKKKRETKRKEETKRRDGTHGSCEAPPVGVCCFAPPSGENPPFGEAPPSGETMSQLQQSSGTDLSIKKCVPCDTKDLKHLTEDKANLLISQVPEWELVNESGVLKLHRSWKVKSFTKGLEFFQVVADVAEAEGHHPDLHLVGWNNVKIDIWTHSAVCIHLHGLWWDAGRMISALGLIR